MAIARPCQRARAVALFPPRESHSRAGISIYLPTIHPSAPRRNVPSDGARDHGQHRCGARAGYCRLTTISAVRVIVSRTVNRCDPGKWTRYNQSIRTSAAGAALGSSTALAASLLDRRPAAGQSSANTLHPDAGGLQGTNTALALAALTGAQIGIAPPPIRQKHSTTAHEHGTEPSHILPPDTATSSYNGASVSIAARPIFLIYLIHNP